MQAPPAALGFVEIEELEIPGGIAGIRERMAAMGHGPLVRAHEAAPEPVRNQYTERADTGTPPPSDTKAITKPKTKARTPRQKKLDENKDLDSSIVAATSIEGR